MDNPRSKLIARQYEECIGWANWKLNSLSDKDLEKETAPGKNTGIWLFGHLITCEDDFALFMGKGGITYPEYQKMFGEGTKPLPAENYPSVSEMRAKWKEMLAKNKKIYDELKDEEFDEPHAELKDENDPCKTKEDIMIHWQVHLMYHVGQIGMITPAPKA